MKIDITTDKLDAITKIMAEAECKASTLLGNDVKLKVSLHSRYNYIENTEKLLPLLHLIADDAAVLTDAIIRSGRRAEVSNARQLFCYIAFEDLGISSVAIGKFLQRDHATVLYSCSRIRGLLGVDMDLKRQYQRLKSRLEIL